MIETKDGVYALYGAGVDASDEEVISSYRALIEVYNQIQAKKDEAIEAQKNRPLFQLPQINIQLPKVELPQIEIPQIRFQSPFVFGKKDEDQNKKALPGPNQTSDQDEGLK